MKIQAYIAPVNSRAVQRSKRSAFNLLDDLVRERLISPVTTVLRNLVRFEVEPQHLPAVEKRLRLRNIPYKKG